MAAPTPALLPRLVWACLALLALAAVAAMAWAVFQRVPYAFELEWMEGSMVDHTARVLDGKPIYAAPTVEHVPYLYTPLYFYASALVAQLGMGLDFAALRLVNVASTLLACALFAWLLRKELGAWLPALVAASIPIAGYGYVDSWYDLSRNDGLFYLLVFGAIALLRHGRSGWLPAAGLLAAMAFLAKQSAVFVLPGLCLGALCLGVARAVWFGVWSSVALGLAVLCFHWATDGWFTFFVFEMPSGHGVNGEFSLFWTDWERGILPLWPAVPLALGVAWMHVRDAQPARGRWSWMLLAAVMFAGLAWLPLLHGSATGNKWVALGSCVLWPAIVAAGALGSTAPTWTTQRSDLRRGRGFWIVQSASMFALAWISRRHAGGHLNAFIPALFAAGILAGYALRCASRPGRAAAWLPIAAALTVMVFVHLGYDPRRFVPRDANRAANPTLARWIEAVDGDVLMLYHGHLAARAGKARTAHAMAVADLYQYQGGQNRGFQRFLESVSEAGRDQRFGAVVLDAPFIDQARAILAPLLVGMRPTPTPLARPRDLQPVVGMPNAFPVVFLTR